MFRPLPEGGYGRLGGIGPDRGGYGAMPQAVPIWRPERRRLRPRRAAAANGARLAIAIVRALGRRSWLPQRCSNRGPRQSWGEANRGQSGGQRSWDRDRDGRALLATAAHERIAWRLRQPDLVRQRPGRSLSQLARPPAAPSSTATMTTTAASASRVPQRLRHLAPEPFKPAARRLSRTRRGPRSWSEPRTRASVRPPASMTGTGGTGSAGPAAQLGHGRRLCRIDNGRYDATRPVTADDRHRQPAAGRSGSRSRS